MSEATQNSRFDECIQLREFRTESSLLRAFSTFGREQLSAREYLLVAYNGERFRDGFDLPFLRTRLAHRGVTWPFDDLPYADLYPIFAHRFNTYDGTEERNDLESVYDDVVGGDLSDGDPLEN
ncbi:MAG: hypothetical protein ABEI52_00490, partial [Halobacteriaceae archaeon]